MLETNSQQAVLAFVEAAAGFDIQCFVSEMWREAEKSTGSRVDSFFVEDGTFVIDGMVEAAGRNAIRKVGAYREELGRQQGGARHSRHLMSNYCFDYSALDAEGRVTGQAVMTHFGGSGEPPLQLTGPLGIYDVRIVIEKQAEKRWLLRSLYMRPIFVAADHPTRDMPKSYSHPGSEDEHQS